MILWVLVIVASVILDQITKLLVTGNMALYESVPVIPHVFSFTYIHNYGAAWGIFSEHRWIFIVITGIAIIVLPIFLYRYRKLHFLFGLSLSLIIGGAIGNMIDRVFRGFVIDFLEFTFIDFPVFNIADICVTVGTVLMFIYIAFIDKTLFADKKEAQTAQTNGEETLSNAGDQQKNDCDHN